MKKKIVWITGASSGIGRALAIKFAKEGWTVAASARRENLLKELNVENYNIHPYPLDVTNIEQCKSVFKNILRDLKDIHICVFGAGIDKSNSEKIFDLKNIREIMEVNFFGVINSVNSIYEFYSKQKSGQISIISSVAGYRGLPAAGAYCSSKSALISFTESLYFDMIKKNVDVKLINPGFIKTPITEKNKTPMPMIKSPEFAANEIFIGLTQKKLFEIHFPKSFTFLMKFMQILPIWLYFKLINIGNIYMKRD
jgi:short-subunit dehydrogenase